MNVLYRHIELNLDSESSARGSLKNARAKLKFSFKNDASVNEQDRDGGGTLDRIEVAVGLFKMGIWLSPLEVQRATFNPILPDTCMHIFQIFKEYEEI